MNRTLKINSNRLTRQWMRAVFAGWLICAGALTVAAANSPTVVPKHSRFEGSFSSAVAYRNPLADVNVTVLFTSPQGDLSTVGAFWDGGKTWRVRFAPDVAGKWRFKTTCTDKTNGGLQNITGEFICTPAVGKSRFDLHGPVRLSPDQRHLEHEDETPFFWLGDTVWTGARMARLDEWQDYAGIRSAQKFTVAQWVAAPGMNLKKQTAYTGNRTIVIDPLFFKQLDIRIETLGRAGILSAIVPLRDASGTNALDVLPEDQAILLIRYMATRWNADNVVWVLSCEGEGFGGKINRWKRIGRAVFGKTPHAPVMLYPGDTYWALEEFRTEPWLDLLGYQSGREVNDDALQWMAAGPLLTDWKKPPPHPIINLALPYENDPAGQSQTRATPDAIRRAAYWSVLNAPPAGVSYGGNAVLDWTITIGGKEVKRDLRPWRKGLFLPAAKQMGILDEIFSSVEFWRLRPAPEIIAKQPGLEMPARHIAAARTESGDLTVIYVPEERSVKLFTVSLPPKPAMEWINPRTGERLAARAIVGDQDTCDFPTPGEGDWVLTLRTLEK